MALQTTNSTFLANKVNDKGAGIYTWVQSCSIDLNSSIIVQTAGSTFTSNIANGVGAGICTSVHHCSVDSHSSITIHTISSNLVSNKAANGGGIYTLVKSCSVDSVSYIKMQTHSNFTFNIAHWGAGICTFMAYCSVASNSSIILQTTGSIFSFNDANYDGAGLYTEMDSCSIHSDSWFQTQVRDCSFLSNRAGRGASLCLEHQSGCVSGEITVAVSYCRFQNNSVSRDGSSLFFRVFLITQIKVEQSHFETNRAILGSGLHRENLGVETCQETCDTPNFGLKNQGLIITTYITQCQFIGNIGTVIHMKSKVRYGTSVITKCSFNNNRCVNSSYAEDISTELDLELSHIIILKTSKYQSTIAINSQSDANVRNVTVITSKVSHQNKINIAQFSHFITDNLFKNDSFSLEYHCPAFFQPTLSTAGLTDTGAAMVQVSCETCFKGYFTGQTRMVILEEKDNDHNCQEKQIFDKLSQPTGKYVFCYKKSMGTCIECPHGANCSAGVVSLPNYWGHITAANRLEFHRCPVGYCCNQIPCSGIAQCAAHREGTLCGRCMKGFTESLVTPECIPNQICSDWWVLPLFCFWTLAVTIVLVFSQDILKIMKKIYICLETCNSNRERADKNDGMEPKRVDSIEFHSEKQPISHIGLRRRHSIEIRPIQHTVSSSNAVNAKSYMDIIKIQTSGCAVKIPILWGLLTIHRGEHIETSSRHKYLQIMLYYLQDAALMQIDLALVSTVVTPIQNLRKMLLNVSQLAVDLIDIGLNLCPFLGWTPVAKHIMKTLTGPLVFCCLFAIYGIVRFACLCSPSKGRLLRNYWYPRLTSAAIFSMLLFYQQIANVAFSLLYCIKSQDHAVLFIDGNITCYKSWQILVFIFAFNWVVGIIPVLMLLPGLLELRLIKVSHFFLACLMPGPMVFYWLVTFYGRKPEPCIPKDNVPSWHEEALKILQKTFEKTMVRKGLPICWIGFMKVRRLALVLLFTFVSNLIARVTLMCIVIQLFLLFHIRTEPYQDDLANKLYTASLLATLAMGFINIMKAACVEFYLDLDKVANFLTTLNMITDGILVYCPIGFVGLIIAAIVTGKVQKIVLSKRLKRLKQS